MPWSGGVYSRGYPSWSNDAANNLPISATKFDLEDNDFQTGLNNCLTKDGLSGPSGPMSWGLSNAQILAMTRGSDGSIAAFSRTGGSNNPSLQVINADNTPAGGGMQLNMAAGVFFSVAFAAAQAFGLSAGQAQFPSGLVGSPGISFGADTSTGFYRIGASEVGLALGGVLNYDFATTGLTATPKISAAAFVPTGSTIPANGIYLPSANTLGFATNSAAAGSINSAGAWSIPAPTAGSTLTINGLANQYAQTILGSSTSGQSFGLLVQAATTSADSAFTLQVQGGATTIWETLGNGQSFVYVPNAATAAPANMAQVGYVDCPQNLQNAAYQLILSDRGKSVVHNEVTARTWTIPANSGTAFPVGTTIMLLNVEGSGVLTLQITTDTLYWSPSNATGTRTLAAGAFCTLYKQTSTTWVISGVGIT